MKRIPWSLLLRNKTRWKSRPFREHKHPGLLQTRSSINIICEQKWLFRPNGSVLVYHQYHFHLLWCPLHLHRLCCHLQSHLGKDQAQLAEVLGDLESWNSTQRRLKMAPMAPTQPTRLPLTTKVKRASIDELKKALHRLLPRQPTLGRCPFIKMGQRRSCPQQQQQPRQQHRHF